MQTVQQLGDYTAAQGRELKKRTIQDALAELEAAGLATGTEAVQGLSRYWSSATAATDMSSAEARP
jgi:hypothetical protein